MQRLRSVTISLALALGVVCTTNGVAADLEKSSVHVAVGGKTLIAYLPLTIAERRGYFVKEGLQVEISDFQGGAKALQALVGGSADIGCGAYEHTLYMAVKGQADQGDRAAGQFVRPGGRRAARTRRRVPVIADLKGMTIGVTAPGSASAIGLTMLLSKAGLTVNDVSIIGVGGGPGAVAAVKTGKIDAIANFDPAISLLERDGAIKTILDTRREERSRLPLRRSVRGLGILCRRVVRRALPEDHAGLRQRDQRRARLDGQGFRPTRSSRRCRRNIMPATVRCIGRWWSRIASACRPTAGSARKPPKPCCAT